MIPIPTGCARFLCYGWIITGICFLLGMNKNGEDLSGAACWPWARACSASTSPAGVRSERPSSRSPAERAVADTLGVHELANFGEGMRVALVGLLEER